MVDAVLNQGLALDIGARPASAALAGALDMNRQTTAPQPTHDRRTIVAPDNLAPTQPILAAPARRGTGWVPLAGGALVALVLIVGAGLLLHNRPGAQPPNSSLPTAAAVGVATTPPIATATLSGAPATAPPAPEAPLSETVDGIVARRLGNGCLARMRCRSRMLSVESALDGRGIIEPQEHNYSPSYFPAPNRSPTLPNISHRSRTSWTLWRTVAPCAA